MGAVFGGSWRLSPPREGFGAETSQNGLPNANHHYNRFKGREDPTTTSLTVADCRSLLAGHLR